MSVTYSYISVKKRPGHASQGLLTAGGRTHVCALGKGGIKALKREGDGATPLGRMRLVGGWFRPDHVSLRSAPLGLMRITAASGWCDAPDDRNYNQPVSVPYPASHEALWRDDGVYDLIVVLGHNDDPPVPGLGSAIFLHICRPGYPPTEGCIAIARDDLETLLRVAEPGDAVEIAA